MAEIGQALVGGERAVREDGEARGQEGHDLRVATRHHVLHGRDVHGGIHDESTWGVGKKRKKLRRLEAVKEGKTRAN